MGQSFMESSYIQVLSSMHDSIKLFSRMKTWQNFAFGGDLVGMHPARGMEGTDGGLVGGLVRGDAGRQRGGRALEAIHARGQDSDRVRESSEVTGYCGET